MAKKPLMKAMAVAEGVGSSISVADAPDEAGQVHSSTVKPSKDVDNLTREDENAGEHDVVRLEAKSLDRGGSRTSYTKMTLKLLLLLAALGVLMSSRKIMRMARGAMIYFDSNDDDDKLPLAVRVMPAVTVKELQKCEEQLRSSAADFRASWETASPVVKKAFEKYFVPSKENGQMPPTDPLALYNKHIDGMLGLPLPDKGDVSALQEHKLNLLLLRGLCGASAITLKKLKDLEELHAETGVPVPVLGLGDPIELPPLEELMEQEDDGVTAAEFLTAFGIVIKSEGETAKVPRLLAKYLENLVRESDLLTSRLRQVQDQFRPFVEFQGLGGKRFPSRGFPKARIIYSGEEFNVAHFVLCTDLAVPASRSASETEEFLMGTVARQWRTARVADFVLERQGFVTHFLQYELNRKRADFLDGRPEIDNLDPESLQALARFVI